MYLKSFKLGSSLSQSVQNIYSNYNVLIWGDETGLVRQIVASQLPACNIWLTLIWSSTIVMFYKSAVAGAFILTSMHLN